MLYNWSMSTSFAIKNIDYGFRDAGKSGQHYSVTSDFSDQARNHCAATMIINTLAVCCPGRLQFMNLSVVFREVHFYIGNGPVLNIARRANRFFRNAQVPLVCRQYTRRPWEVRPDRLVQIGQEEIAKGNALGCLVAAGPLHMHWILAAPDKAADGSILIIDNWHADRVYRYVPDQGSKLIAVAVFSPTK